VPDRLTTGSGTELECLVTGAGDPVTVFAHGITGGIPDTRLLGSGVQGRRVFLAFPGHGRSSPARPDVSYAELALNLRAVADAYGARRALGVSMGAGAMCRLLSTDPHRFERIVFFIPAVLDRPRTPAALERLDRFARAVESGDPAVVAREVEAGVPECASGTPAARSYVRQRVESLLGTAGRGAGEPGAGAGAEPPILRVLRSLPRQTVLPDAEVLRAVTAPALVLACQGDPQHPVEVARQLAGLLPNATLHVYDRPGPRWTAHADLRARISSFLNS
jgi:pimeloyl-ACP methyl ester carboxylesterase